MQSDILYHYTSLENMAKIIQSKKLWLSSPYYQNDKKEMHYGLGLLEAEMNIFSITDEDLRSNLDYVKMIAANLPTSPIGVYSFSLTYEGDLLSQWRGYTKIGEGVCVGFNRRNLATRASESDCELEDCIYDPERSSEQLHSSIEAIINSSEIKNLNYDDKAFYVSAQVIATILLLKHDGFREEREARLIKYDKGYPSRKNEKYRITSKYVIPYTELDITNLNNDGTIFDHVIIGPHEYQDIAFRSLCDYLGFERVVNSISNSIIPLR